MCNWFKNLFCGGKCHCHCESKEGEKKECCEGKDCCSHGAEAPSEVKPSPEAPVTPEEKM
jgi:hypothetical protein